MSTSQQAAKNRKSDNCNNNACTHVAAFGAAPVTGTVTSVALLPTTAAAATSSDRGGIRGLGLAAPTSAATAEDVIAAGRTDPVARTSAGSGAVSAAATASSEAAAATTTGFRSAAAAGGAGGEDEIAAGFAGPVTGTTL